MRRRSCLAGFSATLLMGLLVGLAGAPGALGDSSQSSNWAGYAIRRVGVRFQRVSASWTQPTATCSAGAPAYSSVWVGLGGYSENSPALEQIGSEVDCSAGGGGVSSVWYELVPAASRPIRMTVRPGDELNASVSVTGQQVSFSLRDLTRHQSFTKRVRASVLDVSSAEWIVEAPSRCSGRFSCQTLPLADFGSAAFTHAGAATIGGHAGTITDRAWDQSRITLASAGRHFIGQSPSAGSTSATPEGLSASGTAFRIRYHTGSAVASPAVSQAPAVQARPLVRPGLARRG